MSDHFSNISIELAGSVARVLLRRPPVNALNRDLVDELSRAARLVARDRKIWMVFLSTEIPHFCAGADLKERASIPPSRVSATVRTIQRMVMAWYAVPQPVVVGVRGAALGGGLELALAGDLIVAAEDAILGFPEVRLGIIPGAGGTQLLAARTRRSTAHRWIFTGLRATASEALRDGVVDYVVPAGEFPVSCDHILEQLAAGAPAALRQAKRVLRAATNPGLTKGLALEHEAYRILVKTKDRAEAMASYLERRRPNWTGE